MKHLKNTSLVLIACMMVMICGSMSEASAQSTEDKGEKTKASNQFKVVGYYSGDLFNEPSEKLQTDKLTHVMYAFLIPKADGTLVPIEKPERLKEIVAKAHKTGCRVYIALGGWSYKGTPLVSTFEKIGDSKESRENLITNVRALVKEYKLDGVELDWEHPNTKSVGNYEKLVIELKSALDKDGKSLTAALNGAWSTTAGPEVSKLMTDKILDSFEFISVMAYDMNNEEHSPLWFANTSIDYWMKRGVPADKIVVGMPLYARPSWMQYKDIVALDKSYAYKDYAETKPLASHYNGLNTLREKTKIAMIKAGGVMLFDVNEDIKGDLSVVSMIDGVLSNMNDMTRSEISEYVTIVIDNKELAFRKSVGLGTPFVNNDGRVMVPLRKPLEYIGAKVEYDKDTKEIFAARAYEKGEQYIKLTIGEKTINTNGRLTKMDTKAIVIDGRTYIPLRAVFEGFGYDVTWSRAGKTAYAASK